MAELTEQQKKNRKRGILKTEEASAKETKRRLLNQQRSKKFLKGLKKKITDKKNVSPVSKITRAAQAREDIYKQFNSNF